MLADANSKPEVGPRLRLSSVERRAAIVKAAVELFSQKGFRGTTTREIAAAVGVTEPVLYQHFATKRDLYTAIVDQMMADIPIKDIERLEAVSRGDDEVVFFSAVADQVLRWYVDDNRHIRLLLYSSLEGHELSQLWEERATREFLSFIEGFIHRRVTAGALEVQNVALAARAFIGMVGHYGLLTTVIRCPFPDLPKEEVITGFVSFFLNGIRTQGGIQA